MSELKTGDKCEVSSGNDIWEAATYAFFHDHTHWVAIRKELNALEDRTEFAVFPFAAVRAVPEKKEYVLLAGNGSHQFGQVFKATDEQIKQMMAIVEGK